MFLSLPNSYFLHTLQGLRSLHHILDDAHFLLTQTLPLGLVGGLAVR